MTRTIQRLTTPFLIILCLTIGLDAVVGKVNIDRATVEEPQTLPNGGEACARAIVESRQWVGRFLKKKDPGGGKIIGQKTFNANRHNITLLSKSSPSTNKPITIHIDELKGTIFLLENQQFFKVLRSKIDSAKHSIRIVTFLFKTSKNRHNNATQLSERLIQARRRGVQVEIILELSSYNHSLNESNTYTLKRLRKNGIKIRFDSIKKQTHTKLAIIDERYTFIGSHNLSHSALRLNNELSLMVESEDVAQKALSYFRSVK